MIESWKVESEVGTLFCSSSIQIQVQISGTQWELDPHLNKSDQSQNGAKNNKTQTVKLDFKLNQIN